MKRLSFALATMLICSMMAPSGCATKGKTGALGGAGLGALAGGIIGEDAEGALIGAAVGTGAGYIIGNEMDKKKAAQINEQAKGGEVTHKDTAPFGGTKWRVASITPADAVPAYISKVVEFKPDGHIETTTTLDGGRIDTRRERYRVSEGKLILNDDDFLINCTYNFSGDRATITSDKFTAVLEKL